LNITTWNVNGLRAVLNKGLMDYLKNSPADVMCFQEIKAFPEQLDSEYQTLIYDYQVIWNSAKRAGYSGVATLHRTQPNEVIIGLGKDVFDYEGRVIRTKYDDFWLYNIYFPNGQKDAERLKYKLDFYAYLLNQCDALHQQGEKIIICGDFNTAHQPIDLRNPKENEKNSGFLAEERACVDEYLAHGFVDVFRHKYPEKAQYTWWTYRLNARKRNIGWRIDYFLVSENLMAKVKDVRILENIEGSDHCPVELTIA